MKDLELIGYTADLRHLVVSLPDGSRAKLPCDVDLLATIGEVVDVAEPALQRRLLEALGPIPTVVDTREPPAALALAVARQRGAVAAAPSGEPTLSPRDVQWLLRAGRPVETVAKEANASADWVQRWARPVEAEREQVLAAVQRGRQVHPELGPSRELIGTAVRHNLRHQDVDVDDPDAVSWEAVRLEGRSYWTITCKILRGGSTERAVWRYDARTGDVEVRNDLAASLGWVRPEASPRTAGRADEPVRSPGIASGPPDVVARRTLAAKRATMIRRRAELEAGRREADAAAAASSDDDERPGEPGGDARATHDGGEG